MRNRLKQFVAGFCALALLCTELPLVRAASETIDLDIISNTSKTVTVDSLDKVSIAGDSVEVSVEGYGIRPRNEKNQTNVKVPLSDAEFTFEKINDSEEYYVYSTISGNKMYLAKNGNAGVDVQCLSSTNPAVVSLQNKKADSAFRLNIAGSKLLFYYGNPNWTNKYFFNYGESDNCATGDFQLFKKKDCVTNGDLIPGYQLVTDFSNLNGNSFLIAAKSENTSVSAHNKYHVIYPSTATNNTMVGTQSWDTYEAAVQSGISVTFTAQQVGTTDVQIGDTTYRITVSGLWEATSSSLTKPGDQRIVLEPNESFSCYRGDGVSTGSDVSWTAFGVADATTSSKVDSIVKNCNTGRMTPAGFCLYQFTQSENGYIISGKAENGRTVYLNLSDNANTIHSTSAGKTFTVSVENGKFRLTETGGQKLFLNNWKNFNGTTNVSEYIYDLYLYAPEADPNMDSNELPGYRRVTELSAVRNGGSYLIAAYYGGTFYFVSPSDSTDGGNRNIHVAEAQKTYLPAATKITFTAQQPGMTVATIGNTNYTIVVRDPNAVSAAKGVAVGSTVKKLRLSKNATFDVRLPDTFKGESTNTDTAVATATINNGVAVIQAIKTGITTFVFGDQRLEVEVIDTGSNGGVLIDYYIAEVTHTKAYYTILEPDGRFSEFVEVKQQEVLWLYVQGSGKSLHFFGAPEPNAALTILGATNSAGNYKKLDDTDPEKTEFYQGTDTIRYNPGGANVTQEAINKGCFGGFSFTLNHNISSNLTFRSEYLPIVTAKPIQIEERDEKGQVTKATPYVDGEPVKAGSWVIFGIEIRVFDKDNITYDSITLGNSLDDQTLDFAPVMNENTYHEGDNQVTLKDKKADGKIIDVPVTVNKKKNADGSITYKIELPCKMEPKHENDFEKGAALENRISMEYTYTAPYQSSGESALTNTSTAVAVLTVSLANRLTHMNLSLGNNIGANVYFPVQEGTDGQEQSEWLKKTDSGNKSFVGPYFVEFGITDAEGKLTERIGDRIPFASGVTAVIGKDSDAKPCRRFTVEVSPMDMTQEISVFVTDKDGNRVSGIQKFKVNDYANAVLKGDKNELITEWQVNGDFTVANSEEMYTKLTNLVQAMQTYGTYLQVFAGHNTNSLPTETDDLNFLTWDSDPYENIGEGEAPYTQAADGGVTFTGLSLDVSDKSVAMHVYFDYDSEKHGRLKTAENQYILENPNGTKFQFTDSGTVVHGVNGYYVEVPDITSAWLSNTYKISITTDLFAEEDGVKKFTGTTTSTIELSALTYAYLLSDQNSKFVSENSNLCNLVHALYDYNRAAVAYFGSDQAISN